MKDSYKTLQTLAAMAAILALCVAVIALVPAFGQWLFPKPQQQTSNTPWSPGQIPSESIETPVPTIGIPLSIVTQTYENLATATQEPTQAIAPGTTLDFYSNDFENGVGREWSNQIIDTTPSGRGFLGQFGNVTTSLVLTDLPSHTTVILSFELYIIRSWDGSQSQGPDIWNLNVSGGPTLLNTTFNANPTSESLQAYPNWYPGSANPPNTGADEVGTLGYIFKGNPWDAVYKLSFSFSHTKSSLQLNFSGSGLQGGLGDESWGIDNFNITLK